VKPLNANVGAFSAGLLFGVGLWLSGMTKPEKVIGFLDVFGDWDPSLLGVMLGAIAVHALAYRWVRRRDRSLTGGAFAIPVRGALDAKLFVGSALFGVGWGLSGYCPGPSVVSLITGAPGVLIFFAFWVLGTLLARRLNAADRAPDLAPSGSTELVK